MKVVQLINQNIPIWSILCGDHALIKQVQKINPKLLSEPNFLDPLENSLRLEVFKSKRDWIYDYMKDKASFALVKISFSELYKTFNTCFTEVSMKDFVNSYQKAINEKSGFIIKRKARSDLEKDKNNVKSVHTIMKNLEKSYKKKEKNILNNICSTAHLNQNNLFLAANRGFILKPKHENSLQVVDGTHRLTAYCLSKLNNKNLLPNELYAFYWEEV